MSLLQDQTTRLGRPYEVLLVRAAKMGVGAVSAKASELGLQERSANTRPGVAMIDIYFEVPGRCVPCPRPRGRRGQKAYYPTRYTDWLKSAQVEALSAVGRVLWEGPVRLHAYFWGARPNADIDNLLKSVLDAIQGIIIVDDRQVVEVTGEKLSNGALTLTQVEVAQMGHKETNP